MNETPQQYVGRIFGYLGDQDPLKVQTATPRRLERLIAGASTTALKKQPAPGKWSVGEILAHLAETELVAAFRIRLIVGAPGTPVQAFDQDSWAREGNYAARDPRRSLALFRAVRDANLALYRSLSPEQWERHGMHAERGQESVRHIVKMFAGHDLNHIQQVERILADHKPARKSKRAARRARRRR